jgi:hypothetical protein
MSTFKGFESPKQNWSKLPHQLIDALPQVETIGEMKVIVYTLRHTWGYQDDYKKITLDEFENGRKKKDGSRIDSGTGLTKPTIINGIKRAISHGFLFEFVDTSDSARVKKFYSLTEEGLKDLTPGVKSFNTQSKEVLHRTEKETSEKETSDISPPGEKPLSTPDDFTDLTTPSPIVAKSKRNGKPLSESDTEHLRTFGALPGSQPNPVYDIIQEIDATDWQIHDPIIKQAIALYIAAVRQRNPAFAIPRGSGRRGDWYKTVRDDHLMDYRIDDLGDLYQLAVDKLDKAHMTFSRPGSLTKTLPDIVNEPTVGLKRDKDGGFYI